MRRSGCRRFFLRKREHVDLQACLSVEAALHGEMALADKGYDGNDFRQRLVKSGAQVYMPPAGMVFFTARISHCGASDST